MLVERELAIRALRAGGLLRGRRPTFRAPRRRDDAPQLPRRLVPAPSRAPERGRRGARAGAAPARRRRGGGARSPRACAAGRARIESVDAQTRRLPPPLLYDLTELQRHANRLFGFSAAKTLEVAQSLYESKKLLSYPRTDSRHLSHAVAATLPRDRARDRARRTERCSRRARASGRSARASSTTRSVSDHHAIIPTGASPANARLSPDEAKLFDLVCRRLLAAWHDDHVYAVDHGRDRGRRAATRRARDRPLREPRQRGACGSAGTCSSPTRRRAETRAARRARAGPAAATWSTRRPSAKRTRPPRRLTDATLLTAMETAGRDLDDSELAEAMRERGLGTPATRAAIIETLLAREYVVRDGKVARGDRQGHRADRDGPPRREEPGDDRRVGGAARAHRARQRVARRVHARHRALRRRGGEARADREAGAAADAAAAAQPSLACDLAPRERARADAARRAARAPADAASASERSGRTRRRCAARSPRARTCCSSCRPARASRSATSSPGSRAAARRSWSVPLIALMEDQVAQLRARGFARRAHPLGPRARRVAAVLRAYLDGRARLPVHRARAAACPASPRCSRGASRRSSPSTRRTASRSGATTSGPTTACSASACRCCGPAPVIALTATATPLVQDDIVEQLGLDEGAAASSTASGARTWRSRWSRRRRRRATRRPSGCCATPERRPAIVYAPTRKKAEALARAAGAPLPARPRTTRACRARERDETQRAFLAGRPRRDRRDHRVRHGHRQGRRPHRRAHRRCRQRRGLLPGDRPRGPRRQALARGAASTPSSTCARTSSSSSATTPTPSVLERVCARARRRGLEPRAELQRELRMDPELLEKALEKLWIHGGALVDADENVGARARRLARAVRRAAPPQARAARPDAPLRREPRLPHAAPGAPLRRRRRLGRRRAGCCDVCAPGRPSALALVAARPDAGGRARADRRRAARAQRPARRPATPRAVRRRARAARRSRRWSRGWCARGSPSRRPTSSSATASTISFQRVRLTRAGLAADTRRSARCASRARPSPSARAPAAQAQGGRKPGRAAPRARGRCERERAPADRRRALHGARALAHRRGEAAPRPGVPRAQQRDARGHRRARGRATSARCSR